MVSIHAPAGGATAGDYQGAAGEFSFNPRARRGRDPLPSARRLNKRRFNPRARRGRDFRRRV